MAQDHECGVPEDAEQGRWGPAIAYITIRDGKMFVANSEYETQVNFCPFCGEEAE
jgi:hypothetical protein